MEHINIGDRVTCTAACETRLAPEDRGDSGRVLDKADDNALAYVGWDSGVRTWIALADLERHA